MMGRDGSISKRGKTNKKIWPTSIDRKKV